MIYAACFSSCYSSKELVYQLLDLNFDSDFQELAQRSFVSLYKSSFVFSSTSQTILQSTLHDQFYSDILSHMIFVIGLAWWLSQILPVLLVLGCRFYHPLNLGLAIPPAEFVVALHIWLGILCFWRQILPDAVAINLLTILVITLLAAVMDPYILDVIIPYVILFISLCWRTIRMFVGNRGCLVNHQTDLAMCFTGFLQWSPHIF